MYFFLNVFDTLQLFDSHFHTVAANLLGWLSSLKLFPSKQDLKDQSA